MRRGCRAAAKQGLRFDALGHTREREGEVAHLHGTFGMSVLQQGSFSQEKGREGRAVGEDEAQRGVHAGRLLEGRFYLEKWIAEEALGLVYGAVDRARHQRVWVRLYPYQVSTDSEVEERFEREIRVAATLQHPHILSLLHVGKEEGLGSFVVSEACLGHSLRSMMGSWGALSREQIVKLWPSFCEALHFSHRKGLAHGYLSPSALWWPSGRGWSEVRVGWFGVPRWIGRETAEMIACCSGSFGLKYRSPEQVRGAEPSDHRSDIYTSGLLLFEMLTGQHPLDVPMVGGERERERQPHLDWRERHEVMKPPRLSQIAPQISFPEALETLVEQMLQKDPIHRPASMQEVLERWQEAVALWTPPIVAEIPVEIPRELPPDRAHAVGGGRLGLFGMADHLEAWQLILPYVPASLRAQLDGWIDRGALGTFGEGAISEASQKKLREEGAWVDLLSFHMQRSGSSALSRGLVEQIPDAQRARQAMARLGRLGEASGAQRTGRFRALTQEMAEKGAGNKSQSVQALAAKEILSLSELEARLPGLAQIQQGPEEKGRKLSPPDASLHHASPRSQDLDDIEMNAISEKRASTKRRAWRAIVGLLVVLLGLTALIGWYLRSGTTDESVAVPRRRLIPPDMRTNKAIVPSAARPLPSGEAPARRDEPTENRALPSRERDSTNDANEPAVESAKRRKKPIRRRLKRRSSFPRSRAKKRRPKSRKRPNKIRRKKGKSHQKKEGR